MPFRPRRALERPSPPQRRSAPPLGLALSVALLGACSSTPEKPDYERELLPGRVALEPVRAGGEPDLEAAWYRRDDGLRAAVDQSLSWFAAPSSRQWWPYETSNRSISHEDARRSVARFGELLDQSRTAADFRRSVLDEFQIYRSVGWNGEGVVLYTGYYTPEFQASPVRTARFTAPLFRRPADLVTDPETGRPIGRRLPDGRIVQCPTRREIEESGLYDGNELVWVETPLDAYVVQVNGSAKLTMPDGTVEFIGYDGKTDLPYTGLGTTLFDRGLIERKDLSAIYDLYRRDPAAVDEAMMANENFVFFRPYDGSAWPSGSLGRKVNTLATLATDKAVYPRGCVLYVDTEGIEVSGSTRPIRRFMLDQDTGGAIRAPGRADIYMGEGAEAETLAGGQYAEGELFYLFLRR
ncbi:MAG: MltA domain-containing protein [Planctomycetota bacterium]|nr:MltA domain-containing protein [Planctomycetota bacterium]